MSGSAAAAAAAGANSNTMYRIGDYVYFENSSSASYAIRRIEELNRSGTGNVEARVRILVVAVKNTYFMAMIAKSLSTENLSRV